MGKNMYENDYVELKWGTLKGWKLENPKAFAKLQEWAKEGSSMSVMCQHDTPKQKQLICEIIEIVNKPVYLHWDDKEVSVEEAKEYVMNYGV